MTAALPATQLQWVRGMKTRVSCSDQEERYYTCKNSSVKQISSSLADTVFKLREESKLLRKAHQEVHSQLLNAQVVTEGVGGRGGLLFLPLTRVAVVGPSDLRKHTKVKGPVCLQRHVLERTPAKAPSCSVSAVFLQSSPSVPSMISRPSGGRKFRGVICILDNVFVFQGGSNVSRKPSLQQLSDRLLCQVE